MNIDALEWLRPFWLMAIMPLLIGWWWVARFIHGSSAWESWVDPELQPHVLSSAAQGSRWGVHGLFLAWLLTVVVLAGPVWEQQPVPVFESRPSMIAVVDVSPSMNLEDLQPSRIERLVFKMSDLLDQAKGIELGLLVFAERPYVVSPLTDDIETLRAFLPSLTTDLAPVPGSELHLAIDKAVALFQQAGKTSGQIVLFTDSRIDEQDIDAADAAREAGYWVSVIGVGTTNGAPLRDRDGQFVRDQNGSLVVPKIDVSMLRSLADAGGGVSTLITRGNSDIESVFRLSDSLLDPDDSTLEQGQTSDYWVEHGVWLLPFFALFSLGFFRRGLAL